MKLVFVWFLLGSIFTYGCYAFGMLYLTPFRVAHYHMHGDKNGEAKWVQYAGEFLASGLIAFLSYLSLCHFFPRWWDILNNNNYLAFATFSAFIVPSLILGFLIKILETKVKH